MSRVRARSGPSISLFPFLAVLLCTMGSLLVLLVLFSRSASRADSAAAEAARRQQEDDLAQARDELAWRLEQLQAIRSSTADDLSRARMQLAGAEDDARTLVDELAALERLAAALEADATAEDDEEISSLERRLAEVRGTLADAHRDAAERPPAYAVVPYVGSNGTHRRPLYIECCIDGVFLQPEGIRLGPADFEGPPGPGNPLASALRAAREHIARNASASGEPGAQPYPLLLVRPTGVMAYYAARESLQSWGSEFGYQLVDEDWTLTYPARDPALAEVEARAVEEARQRLQWLAQVRPPRRTKPTQQFRAAPTRGGVMSEDGPSVLGDQSRWNWTEEQAAGGGSQGGPGRGVSAGGAGDGDTARGDALLGRGGAAGSRSAVAGAAAGSGQPGGYSGPTRFYAGASEPQESGVGGGPGGAGGRESGGAESPAGSSVDGLTGVDASGADGTSSAGTESGAGSHTGASGESSGLAGGGATGTGSNGGTSGASAGGAGTSGGGGGPALPGMAGGQAGGSSASLGATTGSGGSGSLAGRRGSNWASLATQDRPIPLTRPIRLECAAHEFRILASGGRVQSRIPIGTYTAGAVDPLVQELHAEVGRWGLAGDRMYWKPLLVLSATADGQSRRDDLERLLVDSGIDTRRSETRDKVHPLPPVIRTGAVVPAR
jgi:hypothetical protein